MVTGKIDYLKGMDGTHKFPVTVDKAVYVSSSGKKLSEKLSDLEFLIRSIQNGNTGNTGNITSSSLYPYYEPIKEDGAESPMNRVYKNWNVAELYNQWDSLVTRYPNYIKKEIAPYKDMSNSYELRRYVMEPEFGYEKTIYLGAGIHGTEWASKLCALRIAQIICEDWETSPQLSYLRNKVRIFIIPVANPWGHDNKSLCNSNATANTGSATAGVNLNRNYDSIRINTIPSSGSDHNGAFPFSENETKWVRDTLLERIGINSIHYAFDFHDAPTQTAFGDYWINFNTFHETSKRETLKLIYYLAKKNITTREPYIWHDKDTITTGTFASWTNKVIGIPSSTVEHCYNLGEPFNDAFMKRAVEVYLNTIIVHSIADHLHPVVQNNRSWFDLKWSKAGANTAFWRHDSYENVIALWDEVATKYPNVMKKSPFTVNNSDGKPVPYYTIGSKKYRKTVLVLGARAYPNTGYIPFTLSMLRFAELLCESGEKIDHLAEFRRDTRIVFVPYLEWGAYYLNASGNFAADGTPTTSKIPVSNIISIMDNIGTIDGVIYSMELNNSNIAASETTDVFALPAQDTNDRIMVENYVEHLKGKDGVIPLLTKTTTGEFANYVFNKRNIPCVRIDTGINHSIYNKHKSDFADSAGVVTATVEQYLKLNDEVARRITNIANIIKLMI